ncbi:MAG TPA: MlaD family protein [Acidimicrobiales bacterium]|nr:MlaD family protein [Acidimicrobiales bacterium]
MRLPKLSGPNGRLTLKFAIFAVICLVILGFLAKEIGNLSFFTNRVTYKAELSDASGLAAHNAVKISGVPVGSVKSVAIHHGEALVTFTVAKGDRLRSSSQVGLQWRNVLGQKYLYVYPGQTGSYLHDGATIPLSQEVPGGEVGQLLNTLGPVLKSVNPQEANAFVQAVVQGLQGNQAKVSDLIDKSSTLAQNLGSMDSQVGSLINNMHTVLKAVAAHNGDLSALINHLSAASGTLAARNDTLDTAVGELANMNQHFRQLLESNTGNINQIVDNLQSVSNVLAKHHADLQATLATIGSGFDPYFQISGYGQWFQVRTVYNCLAGQAACGYQNPLGASPPPPPGGLPAPGGSPSSGPGPPSAGGGAPATPPGQNQAVNSFFNFATGGRAS